jgi:bifunctional non-homologous end joining protein LigD
MDMAFQRKKPADIGIKAAFPGFIEPALATSVGKVPSGDRWLHEIKFDGYRVQVHLVNRAVRVFTRRGNDWTKRFKKIAADAWHIAAGSAIIDGEIVVPAADGTTDFSVLQKELKGKSTKIVMVAFDLLYLNGYDLRKLPLIERKAHLKLSVACPRLGTKKAATDAPVTASSRSQCPPERTGPTMLGYGERYVNGRGRFACEADDHGGSWPVVDAQALAVTVEGWRPPLHRCQGSLEGGGVPP